MRDLIGYLLLACLVFGLGACNQGREERQQKVEEEALLALHEARAWQRKADLLLSTGDVQGAIASVRGVLSVRFPAGLPEGEDARLDARARLAQLLVRSEPSQEDEKATRAEEDALREIEMGKKEATRDSFFRANLESVEAEIFEARARRTKEEGVRKEASKRAIAALEQAIAIDQRLMKSLLQAGTKEAKP